MNSVDKLGQKDPGFVSLWYDDIAFRANEKGHKVNYYSDAYAVVLNEDKGDIQFARKAKKYDQPIESDPGQLDVRELQDLKPADRKLIEEYQKNYQQVVKHNNQVDARSSKIQMILNIGGLVALQILFRVSAGLKTKLIGAGINFGLNIAVMALRNAIVKKKLDPNAFTDLIKKNPVVGKKLQQLLDRQGHFHIGRMDKAEYERMAKDDPELKAKYDKAAGEILVHNKKMRRNKLITNIVGTAAQYALYILPAVVAMPSWLIIGGYFGVGAAHSFLTNHFQKRIYDVACPHVKEKPEAGLLGKIMPKMFY